MRLHHLPFAVTASPRCKKLGRTCRAAYYGAQSVPFIGGQKWPNNMFNFSSVKKVVEGVQERLDTIVNERRQINAELGRVTNAAANKADLRAMVDAWLARAGTGFGPTVAAAMARHHANGNVAQRDVGFFGAMESASGGVGTRELDMCMAAVFGPAIRTALQNVIDDLDWPNEGLPKVERAAELLRLNNRAKELDLEKADLIKSAHEVGLDV